jgi:hypothetical protein
MNKKFIYISFPLLFITYFAFPQKAIIKTVQQFQDEIDSVGLSFTMPSGYHLVPIKTNTEIRYAFAIKNDKEDFEIRYSYWSLKPLMKEYEKCKLDTGCKMDNPDRTYRLRAEEHIKKLTDGQPQAMMKFDETQLMIDFNADKGAFCFYSINNDFGKGYSIAQSVVLHKDGVADIIVTLLSNDRVRHEVLFNSIFNALKFKPAEK